jgi:hypothetical protein
MALTEAQLEAASRDCDDLGLIVNGLPTAPDVVTRLGVTVPPVAKVIAEQVLQEETATEQAVIATTKAGEAAASAAGALTSKNAADADATATAADRVQTGADRTATAADRVQTGADRVQTDADATATAADRVQTGLDRTATAADRVQTDNDVLLAALSVSQAAAAATAAGPSKVYVLKADATADLASIAANAIIMVVADESNYNFPTYYQKVAGALVLKSSPFSLLVNAITPKAFGATGTGNDATALTNAAAAALAQNLPLYITSNVNVTTTITLPDVPVVFSGGIITGTGAVTFMGPVQAQPVRIFDDTINVKLFHFRQVNLFCEWWGGKVMTNLRAPTISASNPDSTNAWKRLLASGTAWYGGGFVNRYALNLVMLGFYAITDELMVNNFYVNIQGKNPSFGGTGFCWAGTPDPTKSILHLLGSQFSRIESVGFVATKGTDASTRLMAAIRTNLTTTAPAPDTQRKHSWKNILIGDLGQWIYPGTGLMFQNGLLDGGTGSTNGNDDFYEIEGLWVADTYFGIQQTQSQAVCWSVNNFQFAGGHVMFCSTRGRQPLRPQLVRCPLDEGRRDQAHPAGVRGRL